jgi:hypothetical protein
MEDFAFAENGLEEGIAHSQSALELLGAVDEEVHGNTPLNEPVQLPDPVGSQGGAIALDDQEVRIAVPVGVPASGASEKDDPLRRVLLDDLRSDVPDVLPEISVHEWAFG